MMHEKDFEWSVKETKANILNGLWKIRKRAIHLKSDLVTQLSLLLEELSKCMHRISATLTDLRDRLWHCAVLNACVMRGSDAESICSHKRTGYRREQNEQRGSHGLDRKEQWT